MEEIIKTYFFKNGIKFVENFALLTKAILKTGTCNSSELSASLCPDTKQNQKANEMRIQRFLQNKNFQIDDAIWRKYTSFVFDLTRERGLINKGDNILIKIDYTSETDNFLILMASLEFGEKTIPIFFTMRNFPKKKGVFDKIKMEEAFIKGLRHILSKKYTYTIVADRGFGTLRFIELCEKNNFDYVVRICDNLIVKKDEKTLNLQSFNGKNDTFSAQVIKWKKNLKFEIKTSENSTWFLATNLENTEVSAIYEKRFGIEKLFQDQKTSGFNIERTKIRKYDRFKRLYFTVCFAQVIVVVLGDYIVSKNHPIKKNFSAYTGVISAFSRLDYVP